MIVAVALPSGAARRLRGLAALCAFGIRLLRADAVPERLRRRT